MNKFYPELHIPSQEFKTSEEAIEHFKSVYGHTLVAVITSEPEMDVVWESDKLPAERDF